jgi:hypothetical protein
MSRLRENGVSISVALKDTPKFTDGTSVRCHFGFVSFNWVTWLQKYITLKHRTRFVHIMYNQFLLHIPYFT